MTATEEINKWIAEFGNERDALNVALTRLAAAEGGAAVVAIRCVAFECAAKEIESCCAAWGTQGDYLLFAKQLAQEIRDLK